MCHGVFFHNKVPEGGKEEDIDAKSILYNGVVP